MGGRSSSNSPRAPVPTSNPGTGDGGGGGGGIPGNCPDRLDASISGPSQGIVVGSWVDVVLQGPTPARIVLVDPVSGNVVGSLMAVPDLAVLIRCLQEGTAYRATVVRVSGGRIDITILRQ